MRNARYKTGSALILTVVLTSLLAIIGVMFVMIARVNKMATSGISENKELNFAVETVVAKISQELVLDVPGMPEGDEYYDYPDEKNRWLASPEPYDSGGYKWRQISDVYNKLGPNFKLDAEIIPDYQKPYYVGDSNGTDDYPADADGDGVADSKWVKLEGITSNKGKPIYAAVRVVDNGGMLNVNTVFANPGGSDERKGDMLTDIYIDGLVKSGTDLITTFLDNRSNASDANTYYTEAARRIENPDTTTNYYTFYDISEELSLRNRYVLLPGQSSPTQPWLSSMTRLESYGPPQCLSTTLRASRYGNAFAPYTSSDFGSWKRRLDPFDVGTYGSEPNSNNYDFRHLLTTYNMDRIIRPDGGKMVNINNPADSLYGAIRAGIYDYDPNFAEVNDVAAQMTVNLIDFRDNDSNVTSATDRDTGYTYYGFERPCVYISELSHVFKEDPNVPGRIYRSYAIELYKPYFEDNDPCDWQLVIDGASYDIDWSEGSRRFYVMRWQDPCVPIYLIPVLVPVGDFNDPNDPNDPNDYGYDPSDYGYGAVIIDFNSTIIFKGGDLIRLQRRVDDINDIWITVDSEPVPAAHDGWLEDVDGTAHSVQRDITRHKCIRRLWSSAGEGSAGDSPTLGQHNNYIAPDSRMIQAHPANKDFTNVGEIGMLFRENVYSDIVRGAVESEVRVDLAKLDYQQLFKYLTVFDPNDDNIDNDGDGWTDESTLDQTPEWKVPGRININTAPWYVITQLPWMMPDIAQKIVERRDTTIRGFESIGELMRVDEMYYYANDSVDLTDFPDLTASDGAEDDFEERDVIFARISDLVTVRSDVFTAYILVRIGTDGPQKRAIAILDRSNIIRNPDYPLTSSIPYFGKVRIIALHPVPDPR